jgi:hypothetical protein
MLALALATVVAATPPRALPDPELVTSVPRIEALQKLVPFFTRAGAKAPLVRPSAWREAAHPVLRFDVTSPESLEADGVDPKGPLTLSRRAELEVSCLKLVDPQRFDEAAKSHLLKYGDVFASTDGGVTLLGARDALGRVQALVARKGLESCSAMAGGLSVDKHVPKLVSLLEKPARPLALGSAGELQGPVLFALPSPDRPLALALSAEGDALTAEGRGRSLPIASLAGAGSSPFGRFAPPGALVLRVRLVREQVPLALEALWSRLPFGAALLPVVQRLGPLLTGNVAVVVLGVKVTSGLRTPAARLFAVRFALLAETSDPAKAQALLDAVDPKALATREGTLEASLAGPVLVVSDDAAAKASALEALARAQGKQAHGAEVELRPKLVAKALSQVPLFEAVQTPELAGVLAASTELGPLLLASDAVTGWLDTQGRDAHGVLTWRLSAEPAPAADAGTPAPP